MSAYYSPPPPPRQALSTFVLMLLNRGLEQARSRYQRLSREQRWAVIGIVAAHVMVLAIYVILVDNMVQIENKRLASEQVAQEHHRCAMLPSRLERTQCLAAQRVQGTPVSVVAAQ